MVAEARRKSRSSRRAPEALFADLPAVLVRLREKRKRSPATAARRAGVSRSEWSLWEAGDRALSLDSLARALRGIGATLHDLADELEGPTADGRNASDVLGLLADLHARNKLLEEEISRSTAQGGQERG